MIILSYYGQIMEYLSVCGPIYVHELSSIQKYMLNFPSHVLTSARSSLHLE